MGRRRDPNGKCIATSRDQAAGDIDVSPYERSHDIANTSTVEPDVRAIVDPLEHQREALSLEACGSFECRAVPVVLPAETLRNGHVVQAVVGVRIDAARDQRGQNRAGYNCRVPTGLLEIHRRDLRCVCSDLAGFRELPRPDGPKALAGNGERLRSFGYRNRHGRARRSVAMRQRPGILRLQEAPPGPHLPGPAHSHLMEHDQAEIRLVRVQTRHLVCAQRRIL